MIIYFYLFIQNMIGKYRDVEITSENKINKQKENFEIIKNLYNLTDNDIYYLNKKINIITERYNEIQLNNSNNNLNLVKCLLFMVWFYIALLFGGIIINLI